MSTNHDHSSPKPDDSAKQETGGGRTRRLVGRLPASEKDSLLIAALDAVSDMGALINDSYGVYGLHLNGDPAPWDELTMGGRYEEWLHSLAVVEILIETAEEKYPANDPDPAAPDSGPNADVEPPRERKAK